MSSSTSKTQVATATATTDAYSTLKSTTRSYTNATLSITNASRDTALFRIKDSKGTVVTPSDISIAGSGTATFNLNPLVPGSTTYYGLERLENGDYVAQSSDNANVNNLTAVTCPITSMSLSTATTRAAFSFSVGTDVTPAPELMVLVQDKASFDASKTTGMQMLAVPAGSGSKMINVNGLTAATQYVAVLLQTDRTVANPKYTDGYEHRVVDMKVFTTSVTGSLSASIPNASSVVLSWTGDSGEMYAVVNQSSGKTIVQDIAGGSTYSVYGLLPGTNYTFNLQMKVNGTYTNQASTSITTPTSTLTLGSVTDTQAIAKWTSIYDKANYEVTIAVSSSGAVLQTVNTTALTTTFKGLNPSTAYLIVLGVIEQNGTVAVSHAALGTDAPPKPTTASAPASTQPASSSSSSSSSAAPTQPAAQPAQPASTDGKMDHSTKAATNEPAYSNNTSTGPSASSSYNVKTMATASTIPSTIGPQHIVSNSVAPAPVAVPASNVNLEIAIVAVVAIGVGYFAYKSLSSKK